MGGTLSQGSIGILLNNGDRTFAFAVAYNASSPRDIAVADVNADGKLDVVAASGATDNVSVLLGNGNGTFQAFTTYPAADEPDGISVADFNGDTKPDLAVIHYAGSVLSILLGNGNGTFQAPVNYPAGSIPRGILAEDLNGDNKQDLVVAVAGSHAVYVYIGNGDGTFPAAVSYPVGSEPIEPSIGDLNGDGKDDLLAVNANGSSYSVLRGNADGTFQAAITKTARFGSYSSTLADFDNDSKLDLAIINNVHDLVDVYLNSPSAQGSAFNATADTPATNVLVATFKDYDALKTAASFSATINWGDSTPLSAGTISANGSGGFNVNGTHTYTTPGTYNVAVQISDSSGNFAAATGTANVKGATTTTVSSSVNPSEFGQSVTFTATVSSNAGVPTGSVQFKDGGANLGAAQALNAGGVAQLTISSLTSGTHSISAEFLGNDTWIGSSGTLPDGQVVKPQPTLSINDVTITEGNAATANLTFTVTLAATSNLTVTVDYATANGSATTTDNDYQSTSGTVTFTPGDQTETVTVLVNGDQKTEPDETVFIVLSNPVNAAFSDSQGMGTILNDDTLRLLLDTSGPDANQLAALDSLLLIRDPFRVQNTANWFTSEPNTGVILFAENLQLNPGDGASVVVVDLLSATGQPFQIPAEDVRTITGSVFTQVTFRLPDGLAHGTSSIFIKAHGRTSNTGTFRIAP